MIYIVFSKKSHKLFAHVLCKNFRHCAPLVIKNNTYTIYQFVRPGKIVLIPIKRRDIEILKKYGWTFIKCNKNDLILNNLNKRCLTCVQFTKNVCGIRSIKIQTPDRLFSYLTTQ